MKKQKIWQSLAIGFCVLALVGCGMGADEKGKGNTAPETDHAVDAGSLYADAEDMPSDEKENIAPETDYTVDADSLYGAAAMIGSVVDFSEGSCTVTPAVTEEDGKTGVIAAPGYEDEDMNVTVIYDEGCVVWIATIHTSTGVAELKQASISDVKKQSSVMVDGNFEDANHISATKIIICHRTA